MLAPKRLWRRATYGLARRISLLQALAIVCFAIALGLSTNLIVADHIRSEVRDQAVALAHTQARLAGVQLADFRLEDLSIGLRDVRQINGVTGAWVVDASDLLLSDGGAGGALFMLIDDPLLLSARQAGRAIAHLDAHQVQAAAPVFLGGGELGVVRIDLSLDAMHARLAQLRQHTIIVTGLFVALILFANAQLLRRTERSLKALLEMTAAASNGDLSRRRIIRTNDEIQELAIGFNRMLLRLERSTISRDHVNHIIQSMSEALVVVDDRGQITLANKAACRLFGDSEVGLRGTAFHDLFAGEPTAGTSLVRNLVAESPVEVRLATKRDGQIPALVSASAMADQASTVCLAQDLRMRRLAYFDSVTDLPNRVQFKQELARAVIEAEPDDERLAVFFVDLDQFKLVNDSYGHDVGDRLLRAVADRLSTVLANENAQATPGGAPLLARLGGDEFTIMTRKLGSNAEAARIAECLMAALSAPLVLGDHQVIIGASIGIALFPEHGTEPETLVQNADRAMYWAKAHGRGAIRFFEPMMDTAAKERLELERELREAVAVEGLSVYYQPQVDIPTGVVVGVEALLRWNHPRLGAISPGTFIPVAEASGLMVQIDRWVLKTACKQWRRWANQGLGHLRVAVNVTAFSLQQDDFVPYVLEVIERERVHAGKLEIEVTESVAMNDLDRAVVTLEGLRGAGVLIAIDDFGTGYSSLSYLKSLPADRLKIDRSFLQNAHQHSSDRRVFKAIADMAQAVGMDLLAEGVETREQLEFLRELNCKGYQGFFMSPAIAAEDVLPWLIEQDMLDGPCGSAPLPRRGGEGVPALAGCHFK